MDNLSTYLVLCSWRKPRGFIWKRPYHSAQPLPSALGFGGRKNVKHSSRRASTIALCGITFFYEHTLKRAWSTLTFVRAPREQKLPVIFNVEEVRTILAHLKLFPMGVSDDYLLLWTALARGHPPAGPRY